jgi:ABC-type nitrate/sulfonate/bicarbonate transport system substrate-binding protein
MKRRAFGFAIAAALVAGGCGSSTKTTTSPTSSGSTGGQPSSATALQFNADGTPNLKGMTIRIGNAAGSAHIGDTNVHDLVQFLNQWGAKASQENASQNAPELAVESGSLDIAVGPLPTEVDSGLVVFGPNQARLDDEVLAKPSITSPAGLKGKTIAICCDASPDGVLLTTVLKKAGLTQSQVKILRTGASSSSLSALLAGQVDAAFTAASGLPAAASKFRALADATTLTPQYADSFMAAQGSWLSSHPAAAQAVDLAWLASAKLFNTDQAAWVKNAASYTSNADTSAQYQQAWSQLKALAGWPTAEPVYNASAVSYNLQVAQQQGALQGQGDRPAAQETNTTAWEAAWKAFQQHGGAL